MFGQVVICIWLALGVALLVGMEIFHTHTRHGMRDIDRYEN